MDVIPKIIAVYFLILLIAITRQLLKRPVCPRCKSKSYITKKWLVKAICDNHDLRVRFNAIDIPKLKNFALYFFLFGLTAFLGLIIGCASAPKEKKEVIIIREKIYKEDRNDVKLAIWNETDYNIKLSILRSNGKLDIELKKNAPPQIVRLSKGGKYEYYASAYDEDMKMLSETNGRFEIKPGKTSEHRGLIAGYHLKIKGLRWKDSEYPSIKIFGDKSTWGKIEYGKNKDKLTTNAQIRGEASGIFALILRKLTRTKAGEE